MTYNLKNQHGITLILTIIFMSLILFLGIYFLAFSLVENKISNSYALATRSFYLAEVGVAEMIWKITNDVAYRSNFENDPNWTATISRNDPFGPNNESYVATITNSALANGQISSLGQVNAGAGRISQRIVKTSIFEAIGSLTGHGGIFSGGSSENINISGSVINIHDGNLFSNNNLNIDFFSNITVADNPATVDLEGQVIVGGNINKHPSSILTATAWCDNNTYCDAGCESCPPDPILMPMLDFDSAATSSCKYRAQEAELQGQCSVVGKDSSDIIVITSSKCVFTESEFEDLLWDIGKSGTLILEHQTDGQATSTYYIEGDIELKGERYLVINGVLLADGTVNIGEKPCWTRGGIQDCGLNQLTITDPGEGEPSGILTKSKMNFGLYSSFQIIDITGLLYALEELKMTSIPNDFDIRGGILGRKVYITSAWSPMDIYLDDFIVAEGVWCGPTAPGGGGLYSPLITIEHWEEEY